ncbi:MAG: NADPH-dependent F420 reductase [Erysipelotrichaceae bacterium]|nr:NADPH-dependent F420 reductase [Erysipelotrichaceae bacterium]
MKKITIFGKGNMGSAIGKRFEDANNTVSYIDSKTIADNLGDIVVLAIPYNAVTSVLETYKNELNNIIIIDITNPVDFNTMDNLLVPLDSSAAEKIAKIAVNSKVVKAFNTNFAATLENKTVTSKETTVVMLASDSIDAKNEVTEALEGSGLDVIDAGTLKRARELEALGFLQITLAVREQINWTGGFAVLK